jgi:hypothetical protein
MKRRLKICPMHTNDYSGYGGGNITRLGRVFINFGITYLKRYHRFEIYGMMYNGRAL